MQHVISSNQLHEAWSRVIGTRRPGARGRQGAVLSRLRSGVIVSFVALLFVLLAAPQAAVYGFGLQGSGAGHVSGDSPEPAGRGVAGVSAAIALLVTPSLTLAPTGGPAGTIISASGTGFPPGAHLHFTLDSTTGPVIGMVMPDAGGSFLATFPIPLHATPGDHHIHIETASAMFTVQAGLVGTLPVGAPALQLIPRAGMVGHTIAASGTGLGASQGLDFFWNNPHGALPTNPAAPATDPNGAVSNVTFAVPTGSPTGNQITAVLGKTNGRSASARLSVGVDLHLSPATASVGQNQTVDVAVLVASGAQLVDAVEVYLRFDKNLLEVVDANTAPEAPGVQVSVGDCALPTPIKNEADNVNGTIHLARGVDTATPQPISGGCTLGSIKFKGKAGASGTSPVTFVLDPDFPATKVVYIEVKLPLATANGSVTLPPVPATKLAFVTQPGGGTGGVPWMQQPVVEVQDANSSRVTGASNVVVLAIGTNPGGGTLTCDQPNNQVAASGGVATFTGCRIDKAGTGYTLTATATGLTAAISAAFNVAVGPPAQLAFTTQPGGASENQLLSPQPAVTIQDAGGNTATTATNAVSLTIGTNPAGGTLTGCSSSTSNGVVSFSGCKIDKAGTGYTLTAMATGLTIATSTAFNVISGAVATKLAFTTQAGGATGGTAFATQPAVAVQDATSTTVPNATNSVTLSMTANTGAPGATLTCNGNPVNAVNGVATFTGCKIDKAGTGYTLTATATGLTAANSAAFNVDVGPKAKLAFTAQPGGGKPSVAWAQQPQVAIQDAGGNTVPTATDVVTLAIASGTAGAVLTCTTNPLATASGVAAYAGCKIDLVGTYTLSAGAMGLPSANSNAVGISSAEVFMDPRPAGPGLTIKVVASGIVRAAPGSKVTLALQATAPPQGMSGWDVKVGYNASVVSLLPLVPVLPDPAGCISTTSTCGGDPTANPYTVTGSSLSGLTGTVLLADLTFKVIGARGTSSPLTVTVENLIDPNTDPVSAVARSGQLIIGCLSYDANCDGTVNSTDSLCVLRQAAGGYPYTTSCPTYGDYDTNRIPPVNSSDSLCVLRRAAGGYPPTATCPALSLSLQPNSGPAGTPVTASAQQFNFAAGTTVELRLDSATGTLLASTTVAADKTINASFSVPAGTAVGEHAIKAVVSGSIRDSATFVVSP